jgi:hypothetical protein
MSSTTKGTRSTSGTGNAMPEVEKAHHHHQHQKKGPKWLRRLRRRMKIKIKWASVLAVVLGVAAVLGVSATALATDARNRVEASYAGLTRVMGTLEGKEGNELTLQDYERVKVAIEELAGSLRQARTQVRFLDPFKTVNADLAGTLVSLDAANALSDAAREMLTGLEPTLFFMVGGQEEDTAVLGQISSGERIVELLRLGRGKFLSATESISRARAHIASLNLASLSPALILQIDGLTTYIDQVEQINDILINAPELLTGALGIDEERSYLVLSQNSDELRPSGGYIGTHGWFTIRNGRIENYDYSATTTTSPNPPPEDIARDFNVPAWWIRYQSPIYAAFDGSWFADFPSTAQMASWYYNNGNNPQAPVDGVIGIDIVGFEYILQALGNVPVPEYDVVITPENFREVVYDIRATRSAEGTRLHKDFVAAVYEAIFTEWQSAGDDPEVSTRLPAALLQALQEKHVMFYFENEGLNEAVRLLGWDGAQLSGPGHDYFMVADANLGNKSNRSIFRQITYDVDIQPDGSLSNRATISYDYPNRIAMNDPAIDPENHGPLEYGNLMQVFVASGSELQNSLNLASRIETVNNATNTEFTAYAFVPYDTSQRFQFEYTTPTVVEPFGSYFRYRLLMQKQPGTLNDVANVQVTLPENAEVISVSPEEANRYELERQILEFRVDLATDQWIEIIYSLN